VLLKIASHAGPDLAHRNNGSSFNLNPPPKPHGVYSHSEPTACEMGHDDSESWWYDVRPSSFRSIAELHIVYADETLADAAHVPLLSNPVSRISMGSGVSVSVWSWSGLS